jgi:hypothetical protein
MQEITAIGDSCHTPSFGFLMFVDVIIVAGKRCRFSFRNPHCLALFKLSNACAQGGAWDAVNNRYVRDVAPSSLGHPSLVSGFVSQIPSRHALGSFRKTPRGTQTTLGFQFTRAAEKRSNHHVK